MKGENHLFPDCPGRFAALGALCIFVVTGCGGGAAPEKKTTNAPAVDDKFVNPDGSTTTSSYLIQKVEGAPDKYSNAASVTITVTRRNGESTIKYKAANADKKECLREKNWSAPSSASNFTIDTSGLTDGDAILCLRATDPQGREDSNDVYFQWLHDLTPPKSPTSVRMTSPVPPATVTSSRSVSLRWVPAEDQDPANKAAPSLTKSHKVMVGTTPGGNDVLQQTYGVADYESNLTLPRDGEFYFSVAAIDNASRKSAVSFLSTRARRPRPRASRGTRSARQTRRLASSSAGPPSPKAPLSRINTKLEPRQACLTPLASRPRQERRPRSRCLRVPIISRSNP